MSTIINGYELRTLLLGDQVTKGPAVIPSSSAKLFTVSGGAVIVTALIGKITTVFTSTATTLSMGVGSPGITIHDATILTSAALGSFIVPLIASGIATAGIVGASAFLNSEPFVCESSIYYDASAGNTGQVEWYLNYIPLDTGASVS